MVARSILDVQNTEVTMQTPFHPQCFMLVVANHISWKAAKEIKMRTTPSTSQYLVLSQVERPGYESRSRRLMRRSPRSLAFCSSGQHADHNVGG